MNFKLKAAGVMLVSSTVLTGCLGQFAAFNGLKDWNAKATDNRWVNEVIYLVFNFVPVYGVAMFADALIINSIEFWTGENPLSGEKVLNAKAGSQDLIKGENGDYAMMDYRQDGSIHVVANAEGQRSEMVLTFDGDTVTAKDMNGQILAAMSKEDALAAR